MMPGLDLLSPPPFPPSPSYGYAYCARTMRKSIPKHEMPDTPLPANVVKVRKIKSRQRKKRPRGEDSNPKRVFV